MGQVAKNAEDTWLSPPSLLSVIIIIIQDGNATLRVRDLVRQVKEMFLTSVLKRGGSISCVGEVGEMGIEQGACRNPSDHPRQNQQTWAGNHLNYCRHSLSLRERC